jgi:hydroxyacylglutathione hydrolase
MDLKVASTIGFEREHNELLRETDEARFVERSLATLGPQPPNFKRIVAINRGRDVLGEPDVRLLTPRQVERAADEGALVVDVRTDLQFDEAHVPGALCITMLRAGFGSKLAWLADPERDIVLVGRDDDDAHHAAQLAASVGVTRIGGALHGGMTSWREEKRPVQRVERITVSELHERWEARSNGLQLLDVREASEWDDGHIPGSLHRPYHDLHELPEGLDEASPVAVLCASGQRAAVGASLLQRHGLKDVLHVVEGGVPLWERSGWPVER